MRRTAVLVGCLAVAATPAFAQSKAAIQKLDDEFAAAFNRGNAKAVAAMYTQDAYVLPPGAEMVKGRGAIAALWQKQMQQIGGVKCTPINVKPLGPRAAREVGTCTFETKASPPRQGMIKYAVVWEKSRGRWKLLQDIWNTDK